MNDFLRNFFFAAKKGVITFIVAGYIRGKMGFPVTFIDASPDCHYLRLSFFAGSIDTYACQTIKKADSEKILMVSLIIWYKKTIPKV